MYWTVNDRKCDHSINIRLHYAYWLVTYSTAALLCIKLYVITAVPALLLYAEWSSSTFIRIQLVNNMSNAEHKFTNTVTLAKHFGMRHYSAKIYYTSSSEQSFKKIQYKSKHCWVTPIRTCTFIFYFFWFPYTFSYDLYSVLLLFSMYYSNISLMQDWQPPTNS